MKTTSLAVAVVAAVLLLPVAAHAHQDEHASTSESEPSSLKPSAENESVAPTPSEAPNADAKEKEKEKEEPEEKEADWEVAGDFVAGATTLDVVTRGRAQPAGAPVLNVIDSTRVSSYSLVAGVERRLGERFKVGARLPVMEAQLRSRTGASAPRTVALSGNLELEGAYVFARGKSWELEGSLEVALPTAGGREQPSAAEVAKEPDKQLDYRAIDRWASARGASFARGAYTSSLFESGHLALVPRIGARIRSGKFSFSPTVKVENLFDVAGDAESTYLGEIDAGARAAYRVLPYVEPSLHVFMNVRYTAPREVDAVVVEPMVRFPFGHVIPMVGALLPVAGELVDTKTFGVRVALAGEF